MNNQQMAMIRLNTGIGEKQRFNVHKTGFGTQQFNSTHIVHFTIRIDSKHFTETQSLNPFESNSGKEKP